MQIEQLINVKLATFEQEIVKHMEECDSFTIGTAFIDAAGLRLLNRFAKRRKRNGGPGLVLTGIYGRFNTQADLIALRELSTGHRSKIQARINRPCRFHWKAYLFVYKHFVFLYNGSANFTGSGLTQTGEWMTKIKASLSADQAIILEWQKAFFSAWDKALPLTEFKVEKYREMPRIDALHSFEGLHPDIKAQLQLPDDQRTEQLNQRVRMIRATGYLSVRTAKQVDQFQTEWGRKKWEFFNCQDRTDFLASSRATHFVMVWRKAGKYSFYLLQKLNTSDNFNTPDGRYFIAYKEIGKFKQETDEIRAQLEEMGFRYHRRNFNGQLISERQFQRLKRIIRWQ